MSANDFIFRWGVPELDKPDWTQIPNCMLRNYAKAGVDRNEFLCIVHLAMFKFETKNSEARPSLQTIADLMGYQHVNGVRKVIKSLEEKGMLIVHRRGDQGLPNVYDFQPFALKMYQLDKQPLHYSAPPPYTTVHPPPTLQCTPPLHYSVPKEEEVNNKNKEQEDNKRPFDMQYWKNGGETAVNGNQSQQANQPGQNSDEIESPPAVAQPSPTKPKTKKSKADLVVTLPDSHNDGRLVELLTKFLDGRQCSKRPMTQNAVDLLISKLSSVPIEEGVARLTSSIMNGWQGVFFPGDEVKYAQYRNGNGGVNGYYAAPKNGRFGGADTNNFDGNGNFIMPGSY